MMATHNLSKPLNVFTPQAHKPTILNLHPNNVTILSSSISGGNWRMFRQEMCLRDHLQPTETMGLSGPDPKVVASKRPITRMCMCQNKRVTPWRSLTLEFLWDGTAPSEVLVAKKERLIPHLLDDAESEFKKILWQRGDRVEFEDLKTCARRMEISRKEDAAVTELLWYIRKPKGSREIYEAQLVLVEMLIYQGEYVRATETLEEVGRAKETLKDVGKAGETLEGVLLGASDARLPFYQAVVCVLLGKNDEAEKNWDAFIKHKFRPSPPKTDDEPPKPPSDRPDEKGHPSPPKTGDEPPKQPSDAPDKKGHPESGPLKAPMAMAFSQFKRLVEVLGQEIVAVRCK